MRKTREFELHPAPSWWGKNDVLKELIYLNRIRGDPGNPTTTTTTIILPIPPPSPEHQQTTCHNEFPSVSSMLRQHLDTKKVAHGTRSLKRRCPQITSP